MKASYYSLTDNGKTRDHNEDAFFNDNEHLFFIVADGMGGFQRGDFASKTALSATLSYIQMNSDSKGNFTEKTFNKAFLYANRSIYNLKKVDPSIKKIGTTMLAFLPSSSGGTAFNVGDSRLYIFRDKKLKQITKDHSVEDNLPDFMKGLGGGKFSSMLSKAMGDKQDIEVDIFNFDFMQDDIILLCTDGLYSMVEEDEIIKILRSKSNVKAKCEELINAANKNGGEDNITVTLFKINDTLNPGIFEAVEL